MIAIIDYKMGNLRSVENALRRLGADFCVTADAAVIRSADKVLLPGVGHCGEAMQNLRDAGLIPVLRQLRQPVLGICVGLQVLCRDSEEGDTECIGIFDSHVKRFTPAPGLKIPHMGWNTIDAAPGNFIDATCAGEYLYFVHSYYAPVCSHTVATCNYIAPFCAALQKDNFYATQFHPEKSGDVGERILQNFLKL